MPETFKAYQISKDEDGQKLSFTELTEDDLMDGDVTVKVEYSTLNYKDGLALTGSAPVVRRFPLTPGIDFAGTVIKSSNPRFKANDEVILNGFGVGEVHSGGYAEIARVSGDWLVSKPEGLSARQAMAVGTAGYTAMLCVLALEKHGLEAGDGTILVTGAAGGVGSVALLLLSKLGYQVTAVTGRPNTGRVCVLGNRPPHAEDTARRALGDVGVDGSAWTADIDLLAVTVPGAAYDEAQRILHRAFVESADPARA